MSQSTEQLKNEMQESQKRNEEFAKNLAQNQQFQQKQKELTDQGYNLSDTNINAVNNNTGEFEMQYQKPGENATMKGSMTNGTINNLQSHSTEEDKQLIEKIKKDPRYQNYDSQLSNSGFRLGQPSIQKTDNLTTVEFDYSNPNNETAMITAKVENNEIKDIILEKKFNYSKYLLIAGLVLLSLLVLFIKFKKPMSQTSLEPQKPIDYKKEAKQMLEEAKLLFKQEKYKDAYGKAAQAIRFYYSYKFGLKKEITNYELMQHIKNNDLQKCLNLCMLVEFAKYQANKTDFDQIIELAEKLVVK